jgi:hypothetical protein
MPATCQQHFETMKARLAVQHALAAEGLARAADLVNGTR